MPHRSYRLPEERDDLRKAVLVGLGFTLLLFVLMALAQMLGDLTRQDESLDEMLAAFDAPEIEKIEEEPPPPEQEEEPPELEEAPPDLSLDQLDITLNPGTGGSLVGDFGLPSFASLKELSASFLDFSELDQMPRPVGVFGLNFPRRLLKEKVNGRIVLLIKLSHEGKVLDVEISSSNLPGFNDFVLNEVRGWKFTPPTRNGQPVNAVARLPIPIRIN